MKHDATRHAEEPREQRGASLGTAHTNLTLAPKVVPEVMPNIVVIGYGNTLRRDDGAGVALAEKLVAHWLTQDVPAQLLTSTQILPEMAADIGRNDGDDDNPIEAVVFVDTAAQSSAEGIQIARVEPETASPSSGHNLNPATLLVYATLLYGGAPPAWLVTVPGVDFAHGQGFSPQVAHWLNEDIAAIASQLLAEIRETSKR